MSTWLDAWGGAWGNSWGNITAETADIFPFYYFRSDAIPVYSRATGGMVLDTSAAELIKRFSGCDVISAISLTNTIHKASTEQPILAQCRSIPVEARAKDGYKKG